jgi:hypothetical protein
MRTIEIKAYQFAELSEKAQQKALQQMYEINVCYEWWDSIYEDAKNIGIKITSFDIGRASYCEGIFMLSANEVAQNILNEHGENCETYKTAEVFLKNWQPIFSEYMNENSDKYESYEAERELQEIEDDFLNCILEDYRIVLSKEYEYLTSEGAIIDTIEANEYEFTEDGQLI